MNSIARTLAPSSGRTIYPTQVKIFAVPNIQPFIFGWLTIPSRRIRINKKIEMEKLQLEYLYFIHTYGVRRYAVWAWWRKK